MAHPESGWVPHSDGTFVASLGKIYERQHDGRIEIALQTDERHVNLSGIVHGGVVMTLIDRAIGLNCRAQAPGERLATATLTVNFLRQVKVGEFISVTCRLRKQGLKSIFGDADVQVGDRLVATATGVFMKVG